MSENSQLVVGTVVAASTSTKVTYGCLTFGTLSSFIESINWVPWLSFSLALLTFIVNWYYKRQENKRADEIYKRGIK